MTLFRNRLAREIRRHEGGQLSPTWVPGVLLAIIGACWIGRPEGWHPWGFATQSNVFPFTDLTGRLVNIDQLQQFGNIYKYFDYLSFSYPPSAIPFFIPFHYLSLSRTYFLWTLISLLSLSLLAHTMCKAVYGEAATKVMAFSVGFMAVGILLFPPVYECLDLGQTGIIISALVVYDYHRSRPSQGFLIGIATALKIYPVLFVIVLAMKKRWRAVIQSLSVIIGLNLVSLILWHESFVYFVNRIVLGGQELHHLLNGPKVRANSSILTPLTIGPQRPFFLNHTIYLSFIVLLGALVVVASNRYLESRAFRISGLLVLGLGTCIASLVSWDHYLIVGLFLPLVLVSEVPLRSWRGVLVVLSTIILFVPWWRVRYGPNSHIWTHTVHTIATLAPLSACLIFIAAVLLEARAKDRLELGDSSMPQPSPLHLRGK